jgi:hypothetical protein
MPRLRQSRWQRRRSFDQDYDKDHDNEFPPAAMQPTFFPTPAAFREWLAAHHGTSHELLVGFYRKDSGKPSMTWPESVDEALCFAQRAGSKGCRN